MNRPIVIQFSRVNRRGAENPGIEIVLSDRGPKPGPNAFKGLPEGELRSGGLGLHFMRQSMDTVVHSRVGATNRLRMVKFIRRRV
jgi:anti-sigma regulatory factor (Ser/Thr protein kinase)